MDEPLFGLDRYHVLIATLGAIVLLSYWLPRLAFRVPPASSALLMGFGMLGTLLVPGIADDIGPTRNPAFWEVAAEIVVIVVLFSTGLRIDDLGDLRRWRPTIGLLAVTMPLTIAAVAVLGWALIGLTAAGAILLGAVLAPTDPVLAGEVQVGPPLEGREHPVRFALTTEAGLNDGLAFPFVYLALLAGAGGLDANGLIGWALWDVLYRIAAGAVFGAVVGWLLGRMFFAAPAGASLAATGPGVLALAGVLFCYGATELVEGYGFIAVFVAGVVVRRAERHHAYHLRLHQFSEAIENALTVILLVLLGGVMPELWPHLDWRHALVGMALILVVRPLAAAIGLIGGGRTWPEIAVIAFYGVRGIGSIYYLGYAATHLEFIDEAAIWALVAFTIFASTILHGLTAHVIVARLIGEAERADG